MQRTKYLLIIPLLLLGTFLFSQNRTITGKVNSAKDNSAVAGATISVKGSRTAVATLGDGVFSISAPAGQVTLRITSVGFAPKDQVVDAGQSNITIELSEGAEQLSEVV